MMGHMYVPKSKCHDADYIDFLIATPKAFCCTQAAAVQPESPDPPAHDAFTRLLHRLEPDPATASSPPPPRSGTRPDPWSTATAASSSSTTRRSTSTTPRRSTWSAA